MKVSAAPSDRSEFIDALQKGLLLGAAILILVLPPMRMMVGPSSAPTATLPQPHSSAQLADFGRENPPPEVRQLAHWSVFTADHKQMSFVIVDKKGAHVYVFNPQGRLVESAPALLGSAVGDHTVPGVGDKPLSQVLPQEKTTPAGRFIAQAGMNTRGEDIVWVDYDAAVSMHRVRALVKSERRLERLASPTVDDNRISFGCINLPVRFYEDVLSPTVKKTGAVIYVLPETRRPEELFGSFDVLKASATQVAQRQQ